MKTKEEIEQLAEKYSSIGMNAGLTHREYTLERIAYCRGYEQCQEDMAKELEMHILLNEHDWSRNPQAQLRDFIKSLNKQD
jgi:predicted KAP-like P-loop ATPase